MEATSMSIDKWMDKEAVIHIYNGILLSHKKECIWVRYNEVDEPRVCYTEWSKSEREKQISYISTYIWNLERWYWWTYLQGSNGNADVFFKRFFWHGPFLIPLLNLLWYCSCVLVFWLWGMFLAPWPDIELTPHALEGEVLITGPLGKSLGLF